MKPPDFLSGGLRDAAGLPREGLSTTLALQSVQALAASGVTAAQLEPVLAQVLRDVRAEALSGTPQACAFVRACLDAAPSPADREPLREHLGAVLRLLAVTEATLATGLSGLPSSPARR